MLNVETERSLYFKKRKLVLFSRTIKIGFYGGKNIRPTPGGECPSELVIDSVKLVLQHLYMKGSFLFYTPVVWGLGNERKICKVQVGLCSSFPP